MKCPACEFVCSDLRDICPKCLADLRPQKKALGIQISNPHLSYNDLIDRHVKEGAKRRAQKVQTAPASPKGGLLSGIKSVLSSFRLSKPKEAAPETPVTETEPANEQKLSPPQQSESSGGKLPSEKEAGEAPPLAAPYAVETPYSTIEASDQVGVSSSMELESSTASLLEDTEDSPVLVQGEKPDDLDIEKVADLSRHEEEEEHSEPNVFSSNLELSGYEELRSEDEELHPGSTVEVVLLENLNLESLEKSNLPSSEETAAYDEAKISNTESAAQQESTLEDISLQEEVAEARPVESWNIERENLVDSFEAREELPFERQLIEASPPAAETLRETATPAVDDINASTEQIDDELGHDNSPELKEELAELGISLESINSSPASTPEEVGPPDALGQANVEVDDAAIAVITGAITETQLVELAPQEDGDSNEGDSSADFYEHESSGELIDDPLEPTQHAELVQHSAGEAVYSHYDAAGYGSPEQGVESGEALAHGAGQISQVDSASGSGQIDYLYEDGDEAETVEPELVYAALQQLTQTTDAIEETESNISEIAGIEENAAGEIEDSNVLFDDCLRHLNSFSAAEEEISIERTLAERDREDLLVLFNLASEAVSKDGSGRHFVEEILTSENRHLPAGELEQALEKTEQSISAAGLSLKQNGPAWMRHSLKGDEEIDIFKMHGKKPSPAGAFIRLQSFLYDCAASLVLGLLLTLFIAVCFSPELKSILINFGSLELFERLPLYSLAVVSCITAFFAYPIAAVHLFKQTLGCYMTGIRIVRADFRKPRLTHITVRSLTMILSALSFGYLPLLMQRRALHDVLSRTRVVK
ncbi:MAG: RDD family protein [Deltaproteobacteria bacterium]|nr:RDD family protein [Deltaproteobacteria bacterium]